MLQKQANDAGRRDKCRFGNALHPHNDSERDCADQNGRKIDQGPPAQHDHRACDRTCSGRRDSVDEGLDARALGKVAKVRCREDSHEVHRREHTDGRHGRPEWSRNEVPDERHGDHDRTRRDHRNGDRIQELPLREPMELLHDAPCGNGTIASPLPNTNSPAAAKYANTFQSIPTDAAPVRPAVSHPGHNATSSVLVGSGGRARARTSRGMSPKATKTQMISLAVHAVTMRLTAKSPQSSRSRSSVRRASLAALHAIIAMTAAPIP